MIKLSMLLEDVTILNMYTLNNRVSSYMRQELTELQGEKDESILL